ncbi:MAG: tRNA (adenosine(37)-N6)-threonylcarbamoyltransferase complex transferase subunit TsaD [Verrucomicrobia bacterium]|nr:MAG: tRNA (adenosine(37)-N6)-threonylcarbamoyltransferase complex transferase subunit TsaD [Verrucomicrobiota bacterium]
MVLSLETSCDESAFALFDRDGGIEEEWISSQVQLHGQYGGIVPDLASREHLANLPVLLGQAIGKLGGRCPGAVAVTSGPGLAGCLAMGLAAAKALGLAWDCPIYAINHLRAHAFSPFIDLHRSDPDGFNLSFKDHLPHLGLLVSGGNTLVFRMDTGPAIEVLGGTIDDAAGEALDKGAKLLGLGYPGGPLIEERARAGRGDAFDFPRALLRPGNRSFSFSGLKTSLRYRIEKMEPSEVTANLDHLCASYQEAVVDVLARKVERELVAGDYRSVGLSGGVANNRSLRERLANVSDRQGLPLLAALPRHTGDNAGMVAFAGWMERERLVPCEAFEASIEPGAPIAID